MAMDAGAVTFVLRENLGHGYALRVGYALCIELGAQFVVTLDADGQNDPAEIPVMLQPLVDDASDFVVASRVLGRDTTTDRFRKAGVRVFSWTMSAMGHTKLTDTSNGYRALRVSMLDDVAYRLVQPQYQTAELLIIAMKRGWRVTERPTVWLPRASGTTKKGKNWLFGFRYGRVVLDTWWKVRNEPHHQEARPAASVAAGLVPRLVVDGLQLGHRAPRWRRAPPTARPGRPRYAAAPGWRGRSPPESCTAWGPRSPWAWPGRTPRCRWARWARRCGPTGRPPPP